ncbi:hypothetical protein ETB97_005880 [Aspergillus alliaceus]|uniref:Transcription factor IIIC subunit delta N-term-domain-containing protein n=1 Tax=Petromyces alliaceus TaxID=209559 RepID=A0A8H6E3S9_PETAA|nr:hypothetical protein ETB97_005880 [Aspergillus burnettii]
MLGPVELQLFPSCYDCIAWSEDGEIAVAAGEYVHIITPKHTTEKREGSGSGSQATGKDWNVTRIRTNVFTNKEWPIIHPQKRENFSIGPEQSLSTIVGLAWSPPGLAKYRRCLLAVLTSSLLLSFYDVGPQGRWTRAAIVNNYLRSYFKPSVDDKELRLRKCNIRAFTWCPPLKVPTADQHPTSYTVPPSESRWGMHILAVTNDDNDVILLQARRSTDPTSVSPYSFEVLSVIALDAHVGSYENAQPGSIFSSALSTRSRASSMSPGPWMYHPSGNSTGVCSAIGNLAITWGTKLKVVRHVIKLVSDDEQPNDVVGYKALCESEEISSVYGGLLNNYQLTGPLHWFYTDGSSEIGLAVASFAGMVVLRLQESDRLPQTPWKKQLDNVREQFDIARDLGGYTIARIWGLASYNGLVVAAITVHPGDTVEYRTSAEERTTLIFSHANAEPTESQDLLFLEPLPNLSPDTLRKQREAVLGYILFAGWGDDNRLCLSRKLLYAAACCAIVDSQNDKILSQARKALEWLADVTGIDLADEIAKCSAPGSTIDAKSAEQLDGSGQQVFEQCGICDAGISWYSAVEAQCASGHLLVRCGVTFLAIQEPGLSKFCSRCGTEYLSEDLVHNELEQTCRMLSDVFDTCIYCSGKFQA